MDSKITSNVTDLPKSCRSAMDRMASALEAEDCSYQIADISEACRQKIAECEKELNKQGAWNIALVAYQMDK